MEIKERYIDAPGIFNPESFALALERSGFPIQKDMSSSDMALYYLTELYEGTGEE